MALPRSFSNNSICVTTLCAKLRPSLVPRPFRSKTGERPGNEASFARLSLHNRPMSTSMEILLQAVDPKDKKTKDIHHTEILEQDDSRDNASTKGEDRRQRSGTLPETKGIAATLRIQWRTILTTVAILIAYGILNAGNSAIASFYPIVVSNTVCRRWLLSA